MAAAPAFKQDAARLVSSRREVLDLLGPTIEILTPPESDDAAYCIMLGTIPPGVIVPLHSHADPETFITISGELEGLREAADGFPWTPIKVGNVFHVPGNAKHAFRNRQQRDAVSIVVSTPRLGRFFREVGTPVQQGQPPGPPSPETVRRFLDVAARYGYWNATLEENAKFGLAMPAMP